MTPSHGVVAHDKPPNRKGMILGTVIQRTSVIVVIHQIACLDNRKFSEIAPLGQLIILMVYLPLGI